MVNEIHKTGGVRLKTRGVVAAEAATLIAGNEDDLDGSEPFANDVKTLRMTKLSLTKTS